MCNSENRNNGWATAWSSLITATSGPLNPDPYFLGHLWYSHMCNSLLGEQTSVSLCCCSSAGSQFRSSPWPPVNVALYHPGHNPSPLNSSRWSLFHPHCLQCLSPDSHSIHIIHGSHCFMLCTWGWGGLKDMMAQRMEVNWLCDDYNGLIPAGAW